MHQPKAAIITPCYNSESFIARTIQSVRAQTHGDWEHVVVDDGSTDRSAQVVGQLGAAEPRLRLIRKANGGVASARNAGFAAASPDAKYLLFLDADDCLEPQMLAIMTRYLDEHPDVGLAYCDPIIVDPDDRPLPGDRGLYGWGPRRVPGPQGVETLPDTQPLTPFVSLFAATTVIPSISVMRRRVYELTPGFDESFGHVFEDLDLFLQMALRADVHRVPSQLVRYRHHPAQSTSDPARVDRQKAKLYAKWRSIRGLSRDQQAMVDAARRFCEGPLAFHYGLAAGARHLRRGNVRLAVKCWTGALWRRAATLLPQKAPVRE